MGCGTSGANLSLSGSFYIEASANAYGHINAGSFGNVSGAFPLGLAILGAVNFAQGFIVAETLGIVANVVYNAGIANENLVSEPKFIVVSNSIINTNGQSASYYPGTIAGASNTNGIYE